MAITIANLTNGAAATNGSSQATASISPASNKLILLTVNSRTNASVEPNVPTITGNGLTWVAIASVYYDSTSASRKKTTLFRALGTASSGTITFDFAGQTQTNVSWVVDEVTGMDTSGTNGSGAIVQFATNKDETVTASTLTVTLAAFASSTNACYASFAQDNPTTTTATPKIGFTELADTAVSSISTQTEYKATSDTTPSYSYNTLPMMGGIALEIKEATGGGAQGLTPSLFTNGQTFYAATVSQAGGTQSLTPALFTNNQTFYAATVAGGAVTLSHALFTNAQTFYAPTATHSPILVNHVLSGAVTHNSARVIARLSAQTTNAVLEYATNSGFTSSSTTSAVNVTSGNDLIADFSLSGLSANTQYYYRVLINGVANSITGKFKTFSTGTYSFSFAFSGDANQSDSQDVYTRIIARNPQFFFALGDTPYIDSDATSVTPYQNGYKTWFGDATVSSMLQAFQYQYIWDDHDYGLDDSGSSNPGKSFVQSVYRQHIPHYPLEVSDSIYHSFQVGRVLFLVTDLRSERSGSTFLSSAQMTWFKGEITAASTDPSIQLIVWANSVPWIDTSGTSTDTWDGADAQRTEIANHIVSVGMQNNFCIISADAHMVAADDGTNSEGGFPVFQSAPLNRSNSTKGGPYTFGPYASSNGQYSIMSITDNGTDIDINVKGYNGSDTQLYTLDFTAPYVINAPLLSNAQTFYAATVTNGGATQNLTPALFSNANTFYNATVATSYTASAGLFTNNNNTIYAANVTYSNTLTAALFTNTSTFYSPLIASGLALAPELFSNAQTFYSASVGVGAINLTPNVLSNTNQFYAPVVQQEGGPQLLAPSLLESSNAFFNATLSTTYTVSAELLTNASVIYAPLATASNQIIAPLLANNQTFHGSSVISDQVLLSGLLTNVNVFYPFILQNGEEVILTFGKRQSKRIINSSKRAMNIQTRKRT